MYSVQILTLMSINITLSKNNQFHFIIEGTSIIMYINIDYSWVFPNKNDVYIIHDFDLFVIDNIFIAVQ